MTEKKKISGIRSWPEDDRPREKLKSLFYDYKF